MVKQFFVDLVGLQKQSNAFLRSTGKAIWPLSAAVEGIILLFYAIKYDAIPKINLKRKNKKH